MTDRTVLTEELTLTLKKNYQILSGYIFSKLTVKLNQQVDEEFHHAKSGYLNSPDCSNLYESRRRCSNLYMLRKAKQICNSFEHKFQIIIN